MAKARKILMLIENCPVTSDTRLWAQATALRDSGFQVSIIGPKEYLQKQGSYICIDGIHIYRYRLPSISNTCLAYILEYTIAMIMTFLLSVKVLFHQGFDVIHAGNPPDLLFIIGLFYRLFGKQFVFDQHDLSPEIFQVKFKGKIKILYKFLLFLERCSYRTAHLVIVPNKSVKQFAIERGCLDSNKIFVVYNAPDLERVKLVPPEPLLRRGRRYLLVYVGVMEIQDGVDNALYALYDLVHKRGRQDIFLVLIGDGNYAPTLHALAHELQINEYINFTGWAATRDVLRYIAVADVALTPDPQNGLNEYCSMVKTMEYMAMGKPIVAFDLAETRISAQDAALYATPNLIEDFANKIETLLNNADLRVRMGEFGRKRVKEELNWQYSQRNLQLAYETLLSQT